MSAGALGKPAWTVLEQLWSGRAEDEDRGVSRSFGEVVEEVEQGRLGTMDVIDHDDSRANSRDDLEEETSCTERLLHRVCGRRQADHRSDAVSDVDGVGADDDGELGARGVDGIISRIPAASRTTAARGQNVTPSP